MSDRKLSAMTEDEIVSTIRAAVRAEFNAIGLRVDDTDDQDDAREDLRFLRKLRENVNGAQSKIGGAVILAVVSGFLWLLWNGFQLVTGKGS